VNLVDSSVWIEVLRGRDSVAAQRLRDLIATEPASVAITEPVSMELMAGARGEDGLARVERLTASMPILSVDPARDFATAAHLYRGAGSRGVTVRRLVDCLIAAVAIRNDATVWHRDADYEAIASISALRTTDLR
jgi:predicted nucleic acid-binding protein